MTAKTFTKTYSCTSKSTWGKREGRHRSLSKFFTWISLQLRNMIRSVRAKTLGQRGHPRRSAARASLEEDTILSKSGKKKNATILIVGVRIYPRFCQDKSNLLNQVAKRQAFYTLVRTQSNWFKHCHNPAYPTRATALMAGRRKVHWLRNLLLQFHARSFCAINYSATPHSQDAPLH